MSCFLPRPAVLTINLVLRASLRSMDSVNSEFSDKLMHFSEGKGGGRVTKNLAD